MNVYGFVYGFGPKTINGVYGKSYTLHPLNVFPLPKPPRKIINNVCGFGPQIINGVYCVVVFGVWVG